MCRLKLDTTLKALSQTVQLKGFSSLCTSICCFNLLCEEKVFAQELHQNGLVAWNSWCYGLDIRPARSPNRKEWNWTRQPKTKWSKNKRVAQKWSKESNPPKNDNLTSHANLSKSKLTRYIYCCIRLHGCTAGSSMSRKVISVSFSGGESREACLGTSSLQGVVHLERHKALSL